MDEHSLPLVKLRLYLRRQPSFLRRCELLRAEMGRAREARDGLLDVRGSEPQAGAETVCSWDRKDNRLQLKGQRALAGLGN